MCSLDTTTVSVTASLLLLICLSCSFQACSSFVPRPGNETRLAVHKTASVGSTHIVTSAFCYITGDEFDTVIKYELVNAVER